MQYVIIVERDKERKSERVIAKVAESTNKAVGMGMKSGLGDVVRPEAGFPAAPPRG
jgi:hypothetical protein